MKKLTIFTSLLLLLILAASPAFCTELTTGITYDSHQSTFPVGADFSLKETFEDESSLSVGLAYKNAGAYTASLLYNRIYDFFLLSGGLNYDISATAITPGVAAGTGFIFNGFSLTGGFTSNINPENVFRPYYYGYSADLIFDTTESIVDLSFLYTSKKTDAGLITRIGGGFIFTAYDEGAPATIDIITNVHYVTDEVAEIEGYAVNAGLGLNVMLPVMTVKLKTLVDVKSPDAPLGSKVPFSIGFSTGWKL